VSIAIIARRRSHAASPRGFWSSRNDARAASARTRRARLDQEIARVLEAPHRRGDHREEDQALRAPERIARLAAALAGLTQKLARARVLAEEVVNLAQDHHRLRAPAAVAQLLVVRERQRDLEPPLCGRPEIRRDVPEQP
jgi:hypothetical protein